MIDQLKQAMGQLPYISDGLPGIDGVIKATPEHFQVEEILPYGPCGEGEHVFVTLKRSGWNTTDVVSTLARAFSIKPADVGYGGRKDKQAVTIQTFSLLLPIHQGITQIETVLAELPFDIINVSRHRNKIKTGHVAGNRFTIIVSGTAPDAMQRIGAIQRRLERLGIPNYFGPQRFGHNMANLDRAAALMSSGRKVRGKKNGFLISSLQSALFNLWLTERIQREEYSTILMGDIAKKTDTGGLFVVDDPVEANQRFTHDAIVYTGPIFGHKMMGANDDAGGYEADLINRFQLTPDILKKLRAPGTRRAAILRVNDLVVSTTEEGIRFEFSLPSGAYATSVLREFTHTRKNETD
jgi:tRNA pseudouridine13 synthase